jgi:putative molybdopterin biosynthesis protein
LGADINKPVLIKNGDFEVVDTGDPINSDYDCVIMVEDIKTTEEGAIIRKPAVPYQNIRPIGEDMAMASIILPSNHKIRPVDISSLLAGFVNEVEVYKKIKVGVIPTGDEIVEAGTEPKRGELLDYNSWTFCSMVEEWGGKTVRYDIVKDNYEDLKNAVIRAVNECDMVILNAGSAKGRGDYAEDILNELGRVMFHGISIKPGRPSSFAVVNNKPVFGVPGYPVSAFFVMQTVVRQGFYSVLKQSLPEPETAAALLSKKIVSSLKNDEFIRVKLGVVNNKLIASPVSRGAGVTMSLTNSDGYFIVSKDSEGIEAGQEISVELFKEMHNIEKTLISIGSHDVIMDLIADMMSKKGYGLSSTHTGSMGGIIALKRNETHIAPIHLLDENGEYNVSYVKKYLGDFYILKLVKRIQGFMVQKGNPLNIKDFNDLKRVRYVNRQKGAGTRLLLDYYLGKNNIKPEEINGYSREELTHLTVAAQIAGGSADCGMGVLSAAEYMGLDFVEICHEEYDIAVPEYMLKDDKFKAFYEVITSEELKKEVNKLGGYEFPDTGKLIHVEI